jgi:hypothetical protein
MRTTRALQGFGMIVVYWSDAEFNPFSVKFNDDELSLALKKTEDLRSKEMIHVSISSELQSCVSKPGVNSVQNGKNPDGSDYTWSKQHRGRR